MKILFSFLLFLFLCKSQIYAQTADFENNEDLNQHLKKNDSLFYAVLNKEKISEKDFEKVDANKEKYIPPVLFVFAEKLFSSGEKEKAVYWYYIALLRALIDAEQDEMLLKRNKKVVELYAQHFGRTIEEYAKLNFENTEKQLEKACEFVKNTSPKYSFKWIYLDGSEKEVDIFALEKIPFDKEKQEKLTEKIVKKVEEKLKKLKSY